MFKPRKSEKMPVPKWELVLDPALTPKRNRFGDEITCDNDFGGIPSGEKKGIRNEHRKKNPIETRDRFEPQPREGV